jgi:hypothetical protein
MFPDSPPPRVEKQESSGEDFESFDEFAGATVLYFHGCWMKF